MILKIAAALVSLNLLMVTGDFRPAKVPKNELSNSAIKSTEGKTLGLGFYSKAQFQKSIGLADKLPKNFPNQPVKAGIFPHDLTHAEYVAHLLKNLKNQEPKNILLIGPNHLERGIGKISTTSADWTTPFGIVSANKEVIDELLKHSAVIEDDELFKGEHSINGIIPYLAYYLPTTKIIPLSLKAEVNLKEINSLLDSLKTILPAGTVVIASVDFSHYLTSLEAQNHDLITAEALKKKDYYKIMSFGTRFNDYLDSPPSVALLLAWLVKNNVNRSQILFNTNSGLLANKFDLPVTSYFEMIYY